MITTADFKNGTVFENEGVIYQVRWFQNHKPGKGGAVMRTKLRNLRSGAIIDQTFKSGEKFKEVPMFRKKKQFLYQDGENLTFMDTENFEQVSIPRAKIGEEARFLTENMEVDLLYLEDEFLSLDLPASVQLKVAHTMTGVRGDTVTNATKPAEMENGIEIQVPLFVEEGDLLRVDTRTGEYISRA